MCFLTAGEDIDWAENWNADEVGYRTTFNPLGAEILYINHGNQIALFNLQSS